MDGQLELHIEYLPIDSLKPYKRNAKEHPQAQVEQIKRSIRENGMCDPVGIWGADNTIVEGHGRVIACRELKMETVPCIRLDHLTDEQRREYAIVHNQTTLTSGFDPELLKLEIGELPSFDAAFYGLQAPEVEPLQPVEEDDFSEEAETRVKAGDLWRLGEHFLICGDSTEKAVLEKLMGGVLADMVFTDPPYGVAIGDKNRALDEVSKAGRITTNIENDVLGERELYEMLKKAMVNVREACTDDAVYYVTSPQGGSLGLMMMMMMRDAGLPVRHVLFWLKNTATFSIGRLDYDYQHEPIFYTWTKTHHNYRRGENRTTVWRYDKPRKCDLHPTMKPVALVANAIYDGTREGDTVLDAFGGSGSTLIACEKTGRRCRMVELDPHYCDVILKRWEDLTGKAAVKVG